MKSESFVFVSIIFCSFLCLISCDLRSVLDKESVDSKVLASVKDEDGGGQNFGVSEVYELF